MRAFVLMVALAASGAVVAGTVELAPTEVTEWKAVYGRVEARDTVPARARVGGIVEELTVSEGDAVTAGQRIALVRDDKIVFQIAALDAQMRALDSQLATAETELRRGETLVDRGVATAQRLDQLRTGVDVVRNQLASVGAQREVVVQQGAEGEVVAPGDGVVLSVPVTRGAVVLAGEPVATIGGGGFFLRLAIPERHAETLEEGATIRITANGAESAGRLAKIYPQIENGRVIADVSVENLQTAFVDARVLVEVPVGTRQALMVPSAAVATRSGIDFVTVSEDGVERARAVMLNENRAEDGGLVEVLTGLRPGDVVITP
jgi:RND family efflux transporter MFP subunit